MNDTANVSVDGDEFDYVYAYVCVYTCIYVYI